MLRSPANARRLLDSVARAEAGEFERLVRDKGYYQAAFHSRFAEKLAAVGYGIERDGNSFRLAGIEPATAKKFALRTDVIEEFISRDAANEHYGVVLRDDLTLDQAATEQRRSALRSARG